MVKLSPTQVALLKVLAKETVYYERIWGFTHASWMWTGEGKAKQRLGYRYPTLAALGERELARATRLDAFSEEWRITATGRAALEEQ
jgi:hypothetical protein